MKCVLCDFVYSKTLFWMSIVIIFSLAFVSNFVTGDTLVKVVFCNTIWFILFIHNFNFNKIKNEDNGERVLSRDNRVNDFIFNCLLSLKRLEGYVIYHVDDDVKKEVVHEKFNEFGNEIFKEYENLVKKEGVDVE